MESLLQNAFCFLILSYISTIGQSKPIMVSFGTNQGPIIPRPSTTPSPSARRIDYNVAPAPVYERIDDTPNPNIYKPIQPHQYRNKFYSFKPKSNLVLGTPLDVKYTPGLGKYEIHKRKTAKALGFDYKGPQYFEKQAYEYELEKQKFPQVIQPFPQSHQTKIVPQIGVVWSSGVRYYVPQLVYYRENHENSVYDQNDVKYQYS